MLRDIQFGDDGDFQQQRFYDLVNNDLANTIGNLLNRTTSMARKWFDDSVPPNVIDIKTKYPLELKAFNSSGYLVFISITLGGTESSNHFRAIDVVRFRRFPIVLAKSLLTKS